MARQRKKYDPAFKAKVAMQALSGRQTLTEIAQEHGLHPSQITKWKEALRASAPQLFEDGRSKRKQPSEAKEVEKLHRIIGEQAVKIDFLKKKSGL